MFVSSQKIVTQHQWCKWDKCVSRIPGSCEDLASLFSFSLSFPSVERLLCADPVLDTRNIAVNKADKKPLPREDPILNGGKLQVYSGSDQFDGEKIM